MARASSRRSRRSSGISIPSLKDVEGRINIADGEYLVAVAEVTQEEGDKAPYLAWVFEVMDKGDAEGGKLYLNTSLSEKALWNLKTLLEALDVDIPDEGFDLDPADVKDKELMVTVESETFEGKKRPKIIDFWAAEEEPAPRRGRGKDKEETSNRRRGRDKDPEPSPRRGRGKKKDPEGVTQDQINEMDQDELETVIKDFDLDVDLSKYRTLTKMKAAVIDAAEEAKVLEE